MLKTIAKALRAGIAAVWKTTVSIADDILQVALSVPRAMFGGSGGTPAPSFTADIDPGDLVEKLRSGPAMTPSQRDQKRDGVAVVTKYLQSTPVQRERMNLEALSVDVRATLIVMDEHELKALLLAGPLAIRRFADGKNHKVHGVPVVGPRPVPTIREMSTVETIQERIRERFGERQSTPFPAKSVR